MEWLATLFTSITTFVASLFGTPQVPVQTSVPPPLATSTVETRSQSASTESWWIPLASATRPSPGDDPMRDASLYYLKEGTIYWWNLNPYQDPRPLPGADPATFEVLRDASSTSFGYEFARDKNAAYVGSVKIMGVDRATWQVLPSAGRKDLVSGYSLDAFHVFAGTSLVQDADPHTFKVFGPYSDYGKDAQHVWISGTMIESADPASFVLLDDRFAKDKSHVFSEARQEAGMWVVDGADPKTFTSLAYGIVDDTKGDGPAGIVQVGKDTAHVFENLAILPDADPATFTVLRTPSGELSIFGKDAHHVYDIEGVDIIEGADPTTFTVVGPAEGKDAHHSYDLRTSR